MTETLNGKIVVITGRLLQKTKAELEGWIRDEGGELLHRVSQEVNLVIFGEKAGLKLRKAQKLGIETLSEDDFYLRYTQGKQESLLEGLTIVLTGRLQRGSRAELEASIQSLGGKTTKSVSRNTDLLVFGESAGTKLDRALHLGVEVLSEVDFYQRFGLEDELQSTGEDASRPQENTSVRAGGLYPEKFAVLRSYLAEESEESWHRILRHFSDWPKSSERTIGWDYAREHLKSWSAELRWRLTTAHMKSSRDFEDDLVSLGWDSECTGFLIGDKVELEQTRRTFTTGKDNWVCEESGKLYRVLGDSSGQAQIDERNLTISRVNYPQVLESPELEKVYQSYQEKSVSEIYQCDILVSTSLHDKLNTLISQVVEEVPEDIHPGSNGVANDIIHPSLYPLVLEPNEAPAYGTDMWDRNIEAQSYQWLPSEVYVGEDGAQFNSYINNMPKSSVDAELKACLEELLTCFIQPLNLTWNQAKAHVYNMNLSQEDREPERFQGRTLQVIPKIVEFTLKPGQTYSGVWHFEGMSGENIVATAIYFLRRDEGLEGGQLQFKRSFDEEEAEHMIDNMPQGRSYKIDEYASGFKPLGMTETPDGRAICFPNSHAHRLLTLVNKNSQPAKRRIIAFFLVNPNVRITSTADVSREEVERPLEDARKIRQALMRERSMHKKTLNPREVHLCEH